MSNPPELADLAGLGWLTLKCPFLLFLGQLFRHPRSQGNVAWRSLLWIDWALKSHSWASNIFIKININCYLDKISSIPLYILSSARDKDDNMVSRNEGNRSMGHYNSLKQIYKDNKSFKNLIWLKFSPIKLQRGVIT